MNKQLVLSNMLAETVKTFFSPRKPFWLPVQPSTIPTIYCSSQSLLTRRQLDYLKNVSFTKLYKFPLSILDYTHASGLIWFKILKL